MSALSAWFGEPIANVHLGDDGPGMDWFTP